MRFSSAGYETSTAVSIASGWIGPIASPTTAIAPMSPTTERQYVAPT